MLIGGLFLAQVSLKDYDLVTIDMWTPPPSGNSTGTSGSPTPGSNDKTPPAATALNCTAVPSLRSPNRPWVALTLASSCSFWERVEVALALGADGVLVADEVATPHPVPEPLLPLAQPIALVAVRIGSRDAAHLNELLLDLGPDETGNDFTVSVILASDPDDEERRSVDILPAMVVSLLMAVLLVLANWRRNIANFLCARCNRRRRRRQRRELIRVLREMRAAQDDVTSGCIDDLPVTVWPPTPDGAPEQAADASPCHDSCAVCLDDFVSGDKLRQLNCSHHFHVACIDPWLRRKPDCPLCKAPVESLRRRQVASTEAAAAILIGRSNAGRRYSLSPRDALAIIRAVEEGRNSPDLSSLSESESDFEEADALQIDDIETPPPVAGDRSANAARPDEAVEHPRDGSAPSETAVEAPDESTEPDGEYLQVGTTVQVYTQQL